MKKSYFGILIVFIGICLIFGVLGCQSTTPSSNNPNDTSVPATPSATVSNVSAGNISVSSDKKSISLTSLVTDANNVPITNLTKGNFKFVLNGAGIQSAGISSFGVATWEINAISNGQNTGGVGNISVAMTLDRSGSMGEDANASLEAAAQAFVNQISGATDVGVVNFASNVTIDAYMTKDKTTLINAITNESYTGVATALYYSMQKAIDLVLSGEAANSPKVVLAMTDGGENNSPVNINTTQEIVAYALSKSPTIPIYCIGFGLVSGESAEIALQNISSATGGIYFRTPSTTDLTNLYNTLATSFTGSYSFTITSSSALPAGTYTLTIYIYDQNGIQVGTVNATIIVS